MTDIKKTRTPRNFDSIKAGALSLTPGEQADLVKELKANLQKIADELKSQSEAMAGLMAKVQ